MANCEPLSGIVFDFRHDPGAVVLAATKGNVSWFKLRCPPGTFAEDLACKHCPPGFHCAGSGLDGDAVALPCELGSFSVEGASSEDDCLPCAPGYA